MSTTETETVGQRIRRIRTNQGMSQRELAEPEYTFAYISHIEAGHRTPSMTALCWFADKLEVTALYLLTGSDDTCPFCGRHA